MDVDEGEDLRVTETMLKEELELEENEAIEDEERKRFEVHQVVVRLSHSFQEEAAAFGTKEQRVSRLKHLLEKSSLYSEFLFKRMKEQEAERTIKEARAKKKTVKSTPSTAEPSKKSTKGKHADKEKDILLVDYAAEALQAAEPRVKEQVAPETVDTFARTLKDGSVISDRQSAFVSGGVLRDYQLQGVEWMKVTGTTNNLFESRCSCFKK